MGSWEIIETTEYAQWVEGLSLAERKAINHKVTLLKVLGPNLHRPHADHVKGSQFPNMKELRVTGRTPLRILFCFDPRRRAVLLVGGNKSTDNSWYLRMIGRADELMNQYLKGNQNDEIHET